MNDSSPVRALMALLDQLAQVIEALPSERYCMRPDSGVSGSIGEHVRHCLDHVGALLGAESTVVLSYDHRHRGTVVETDSAAACRLIRALTAELAAWPAHSLEEPLRVSTVIAPGAPPTYSWSTRGRELAFVMSHTIHHQAIVALLLSAQGVVVHERFGHSPSTPRRN